MDNNLLERFLQEIGHFFTQPNAMRSVLILVISLLVAYWLSQFVSRGVVKVAQVVAHRSDKETDDQRALRLRQIETYLSVAVAVVRVMVVAIVGYIAWRLLSPLASDEAFSGFAAIGAGAFFIVFVGYPLSMVLRDIMAGAIMIVERWFTVGDFIRVEPFMDVSGVVERFTLRSTRLRALNGEVIWLHNQQIAGVHVTPHGLRTMAVDVFVRDKEKGEEAVRMLINSIPKGRMMLAKPLKIKEIAHWYDDIWRISVVGQTAPGREWLIDTYFVEALKSLDEDKKKNERILAQPPIARFADSVADQRFRRAVRVKQDDSK